MKNKALKVNYFRTDIGCLEVFIKKDKKLLYSLIVFPDDRAWLELPDSNKSKVDVFPDNALHREWYKEVCRDCGWESEPFEGAPMGFGGTLNCPECQKNNRNGPFIEGCYGSVDAVELDWETKKTKGEK